MSPGSFPPICTSRRHEKEWKGCLAQDLLGGASVYPATEAAAAMRRHHDQIAAMRFRVLENQVGDVAAERGRKHRQDGETFGSQPFGVGIQAGPCLVFLNEFFSTWRSRCKDADEDKWPGTCSRERGGIRRARCDSSEPSSGTRIGLLTRRRLPSAIDTKVAWSHRRRLQLTFA
jgi:hypothetical protein